MTDTPVFGPDGRQLFDGTYVSAWLRDPVTAYLELDLGWRRVGGDPRWSWGHLRQRWEQAARAARRAGRDMEEFIQAEMAAIVTTDPDWAELRAADGTHRFVQTSESFVQAAVEWTEWAWDGLPAEPRGEWRELKFVEPVAPGVYMAGSWDGLERAPLDDGWELQEFKSTTAASNWKLDDYQWGIQGQTYNWAAWRWNEAARTGVDDRPEIQAIRWLVWQIENKGRGGDKSLFLSPIERELRLGEAEERRAWWWDRWLYAALTEITDELSEIVSWDPAELHEALWPVWRPTGGWQWLAKVPPARWLEWLGDPANGYRQGPAWDPLRREW